MKKDEIVVINGEERVKTFSRKRLGKIVKPYPLILTKEEYELYKSKTNH